MEFILSSEIKGQNPGFLLIITGWGESGKVILQVSMAVFWALSRKILGKDGSAPPRKNWLVRLWGETRSKYDRRCLTLRKEKVGQSKSKSNTILKADSAHVHYLDLEKFAHLQ